MYFLYTVDFNKPFEDKKRPESNLKPLTPTVY